MNSIGGNTYDKLWTCIEPWDELKGVTMPAVSFIIVVPDVKPVAFARRGLSQLVNANTATQA